MCKSNNHTGCGFIHYANNPFQHPFIFSPRQNLEVSQAASPILGQAWLEGSGGVEPIVVITDQQAKPSPIKPPENLEYSSYLWKRIAGVTSNWNIPYMFEYLIHIAEP